MPPASAPLQPGQRVLGLFNDGNMSLEWSGELALPFPGTGPQTCLEQQRPANEPSLAAMTRKAIQLARSQGRARLLSAGRGRVDRQAGSRVESMRPDRRDDRIRCGGGSGSRFRAKQSGHADRRHGRPRAHLADHRAGACGSDRSSRCIQRPDDVRWRQHDGELCDASRRAHRRATRARSCASQRKGRRQRTSLA